MKVERAALAATGPFSEVERAIAGVATAANSRLGPTLHSAVVKRLGGDPPIAAYAAAAEGIGEVPWGAIARVVGLEAARASQFERIAAYRPDGSDGLF